MKQVPEGVMAGSAGGGSSIGTVLLLTDANAAGNAVDGGEGAALCAALEQLGSTVIWLPIPGHALSRKLSMAYTSEARRDADERGLAAQLSRSAAAAAVGDAADCNGSVDASGDSIGTASDDDDDEISREDSVDRLDELPAELSDDVSGDFLDADSPGATATTAGRRGKCATARVMLRYAECCWKPTHKRVEGDEGAFMGIYRGTFRCESCSQSDLLLYKLCSFLPMQEASCTVSLNSYRNRHHPSARLSALLRTLMYDGGSVPPRRRATRTRRIRSGSSWRAGPTTVPRTVLRPSARAQPQRRYPRRRRR